MEGQNAQRRQNKVSKSNRQAVRACVDGAGLYLDITASGTKVWRYRYRLLGKREKVTIGAYPAVPLTEARARRAELEAMVVRGKSPAREIVRERQHANQAGTISELADIYKEDLAKRSKNVTGGRDWIFSAYITPKLGRFPLADITPSDVLNFLNNIKKDAPASALAVHGTLKRMFDLAIGNQLMTSNPVAAIPPNVIAQKRSRIRALSPEEISILLRSLDVAKGEPTTVNAFRLLLLTMVQVAARMMQTAQQAMLTMQKLKTGASHTVVVQHVSVSGNGQAVIGNVAQ